MNAQAILALISELYERALMANQLEARVVELEVKLNGKLDGKEEAKPRE
jgi:hypothetical protein